MALSGVVGTVSATNSLVGTNPGDAVGNGGVTVLPDGNYVVSSPNWNNYTGAVTWSSETSGVVGTVSATNSLIGSSSNSYVGYGGITVLPDGNYLVGSPAWNNSTGAVTWGSGNSGVSGTVSAANSLVGSGGDDYVGSSGAITVLPDGNYVVVTVNWGSSRRRHLGQRDQRRHRHYLGCQLAGRHQSRRRGGRRRHYRSFQRQLCGE